MLEASRVIVEGLTACIDCGKVGGCECARGLANYRAFFQEGWLLVEYNLWIGRDGSIETDDVGGMDLDKDLFGAFLSSMLGGERMSHVHCDEDHDPASISCVRVDVPLRVEPHVLAKVGKYVQLIVHVHLYGHGKVEVTGVHTEPLER